MLIIFNGLIFFEKLFNCTFGQRVFIMPAISSGVHIALFLNFHLGIYVVFFFFNRVGRVGPETYPNPIKSKRLDFLA